MTNFENPISRDAILEEEIRMKREQFKNEVEEYKSLLEQLKGVEGLEPAAERVKTDLAFLIEETKKKNPEGWQNDIRKLKDRIAETAKEEGEAGVTWLMDETISSAYIEFLEKRKQEVQDESLKRKLDLFKKMAENSLEFNRKAREQGQPVAFGGVSLDYVPEWYYYVEK